MVFETISVCISGRFAMPSVVLFPKNPQYFDLGIVTNAGCRAVLTKSVR